MVDDAHHEEQRRLEQRVREQQRDAGQRRIPCAEPDDHDHEAELADRAVREQQLQVVLPQRTPAADQHGEHAESDDDRMPHREVCVPRREARHEVDARLHHGGRVQVGAHRGRGGHRGRQPEVERHQCALRDRADQHECDAPLGGGARDRRGEQRRERRRLARDGEQHEPDEHDEPAEGRDRERLERRTATLAAARVVADEEVREHARRLPEDEEREHVVGGDEAEHHACEEQQQRCEAPERRLVVAEVPGAVEQHEGADARDDEREQQ
ncbi:hypothetical protein GCM10025877_11380 [Agromyces mangrovi Wang et al. 2018]|nr:hypothetical protein GCM10025877_11380 [Agromyces mangrovi]